MALGDFRDSWQPTPEEVEEKDRIKGDVSGLHHRIAKIETQLKVHSLILKDLPKKKKEDDPFFPKYSEFQQHLEHPGKPLTNRALSLRKQLAK